MKISQIEIGQYVIYGGDVGTVLEFLPGGRVLVETNANGEEVADPRNLEPLPEAGNPATEF